MLYLAMLYYFPIRMPNVIFSMKNAPSVLTSICRRDTIKQIYHGRDFNVERYPVTEKDMELIALVLEVLGNNFNDGVYDHTVGCAVLCKNGNIYKGVNCDGIHGSCA